MTLSIETVAVDSLALDPANARKHSEKNLEAIKGSLARFGQQKPIVVDRNGVVRAGNGTLTAAKALGWKEIQIHRTDLEGPEATAFALADNRTAELAEWDDAALSAQLQALYEDGMDIADFGFDPGEYEIGEEGNEGLTDPDDTPEVRETSIQRGQIFKLGEHRMMCGDSTSKGDVERLMAGEKAVLMVTDPPYGVEYDPNWRNEAAEKGLISYADRSVGKVSNDDRIDWGEAYVLFGAQVAYVWHAGRHAKEIQQSLEDSGFVVISQIIWAKPTFAISRGDYHWQHEPCWYAHRKGKTHNWQGSRSESTLWEIERGCKEKTGHGTEKPVECMERPVRNNSAVGELVCDPFLGSGSTLIACEKTGRKCYGMEIDPQYCQVIVDRWEQFTGKKAELV